MKAIPPAMKAIPMVSEFTILFVEDDAEIRASTAQFLASTGFRLLVAQDGREAIRLLSEYHADVLFTDMALSSPSCRKCR
jgi:CheY-like chemotaxis protein